MILSIWKKLSKCVNGRVFYIKEKDILKKLLLKFLIVFNYSSSKEMVYFDSYWGLVVEVLKSYFNFFVFYKEVCFFILDSYIKEKGGGGS